MTKLLLRLAINAIALAIAASLVDGIAYASLKDLILVAVLFGVVNAVIKPILKLLTCPLVALTLGIFILVINALLLWLTGALASSLGIGFTVTGFVPALIGAVIISIVSIVLNVFVKDDE